MPDPVWRASPSSSTAPRQPGRAAAGLDPQSTSARPRNRRLVSNTAETSTATSTSLFSSGSLNVAASRGASPIPSARLASTGRPADVIASTKLIAADRRPDSPNTARGKGKLAESWAPSWAAVQDFASSFLVSGVGEDSRTIPNSRSSSRSQKPARRGSSAGSRLQPDKWGPEPPGKSRPRIDDVAAGSLAQREAALRARKTASILESHEGVNGGLDVAGKFKRRTSDEDLNGASKNQVVDGSLVYIHHVQPTDTYAGIVLRYRCREDAFRKSNGLWSRDNLQVRRWLALPVDACEIKGRPCEAPSYYNQSVDFLAPTPGVNEGSERQQTGPGDFFALGNGKSASAEPAAPIPEEEKPWSHVRWVTIEGFKQPVEIGRVERKAMGYFPPRRKKSVHTVSTFSTPRVSLDVPGIMLNSNNRSDSPASSTTRRHSLLTSRPAWATAAYSASPASSTRSRGASGGQDDLRPAWMRRPGGVGTMSKSVRAPGPDKDYFNVWAKKHIPALNIESLPSMSVMGSETAHFGFHKGEDAAGIVESPFEEGRDVVPTTQQGTGLDKAAVAIETWLRGAFARTPSTPLGGGSYRGRQLSEGDLIELADTNSDDGKALAPSSFTDPLDSGLLGLSRYASSSRADGDGGSSFRGRAASKGKKAD